MPTPLPSQFSPLQESISTQYALRTVQISFGDGYKMRTPDGINAVQESVKSVEFVCVPNTTKDLATLETFLLARNGTDPINMTIPGDTTAKNFLCTGWQRQHLGNDIWRVSLDLELVYL